MVLAFNLSSCIFVPAYDATDLIEILEANGYKITDVEEDTHEGVVGYIYGYRSETGDEIYYLYCKDFASANSIHDYLSSKQKADIAEIKMKIERVEYMLYKAEGVSAAEKGDYYEEYVELKEELAGIERYGCGRGFNVVWYGTDNAILDIKLGH